jgi:hypothetical protein
VASIKWEKCKQNVEKLSLKRVSKAENFLEGICFIFVPLMVEQLDLPKNAFNKMIQGFYVCEKVLYCKYKYQKIVKIG